MKETIKISNRILLTFLIFLLSVIQHQVYAQSQKEAINQKSEIVNLKSDDPVLLTIAGEEIKKSEFLGVYLKNSKKENVIDQNSLNEYLDLYINFKLKVQEAKDLSLDTTGSFKKELAGYRRQLAQPYLTDKNVSDQLIEEAYQRKLSDIRASHILLKLNPDAAPKDTLIVFNKIMLIRKGLLKGEKFETVAVKVSEDPSAKENGGDLGYFTVFQMIYPFETAAYNTETGEISMPVRTKYGYHLIKVTDRKDALGEIEVAHIMVKAGKKISEEDAVKTKNKIEEIYLKLKNGGNFEEFAKQYSDDKSSAVKGGQLPPFKTARMVGDFEKAASGIVNNGDISSPVQTPYGWHIIKLLNKKNIGLFEDIKTELKEEIAKDARSQISKKAFIEKIRKEYDFKENISEDSCMKFEDSRLEFKYPEFKILIDEYRDGILLFELTDRKVWSRAIKDTTGLEVFYDNNKTNYMWDERLDASIYYCADEAIADKARKLAEKRVKKGYSAEDILQKINKSKADTSLQSANTENKLLRIEDGKFLKNENDIIDLVEWKAGLSGNIISAKGGAESVIFVYVNKKLNPTVKSIKDARGLVTAEYQGYLEKEWIKALREKYPVSLNKEVFSTIK